MATPPRRSGFTLLELLLALSILAVLVGIGAGAVGPSLDRMAVVSARDALAASLSRTRVLAQTRDGASLLLEIPSGRVWIATGLDTVPEPALDLAAHYGVRVESGGMDAATVELRYDALGVGRVASRTLHVRRGSAEARLTVSTYGRARKW